MSEALLIEETGERAAEHLQSLLTLVRLAVEAGEERARALQGPGRILDPVAAALFREGHELLHRPVDTARGLRGNLFTALFAFEVAASREPDCYAVTYRAIRQVALAALDEVVAVELAHLDEARPCAPAGTLERTN